MQYWCALRYPFMALPKVGKICDHIIHHCKWCVDGLIRFRLAGNDDVGGDYIIVAQRSLQYGILFHGSPQRC